MSGDHTRLTFRPRDNYSAVGAQQGRVTLDADWNEAADIQDRRWRAETLDVLGRAIVPRTDLDPDGVPSGFRIVAAGTSFTIGRGRAYVDGLQPENHGAAPVAFDAVLAESRGTLAVAYGAQPYLPFAPALPAGRIAVYLDVWQREVTWVEDPLILEKAIGVDTTTRTQTVWQVRALGVDAAVTCATPLTSIPAFGTAHPPAAGRLTTGVVSGPVSSDPCVIAAAGGYRGTENRTYRVQIAAAGGLGSARFCFARDNASIVSRVTSIQTGGLVLGVSRIGRDDTLRFRRGDWVEITNDIRELHGQAGEIRQIVQDPDEDRLEITLGGAALTLGTPSAATPFVFSGTDPGTTNTRVKLWHQRGLVLDTGGGTLVDLTSPASSGTIPVPASSATEIVLGDGVKISFALEGSGQFRVGDYWIFAARTIDGSVEPLTNAPPRGIHHHFAKLAVGTLPSLSDCRRFWPPSGGCCTFVVAPGESIQAAIDALPPQGGCVCLKAGVHAPEAPLRITRSGVTLHGESGGTEVRMPGAGLYVEGTATAPVSRVTVHDLRFTQGSVAGVMVGIRVSQANAVRIERCQVSAAGHDTGTMAGVSASNVRELEILDNGIGTFFFGVQVDNLLGLLTVRGNSLSGHRMNFAAIAVSAGIAGISVDGAAGSQARCVIEDNRIVDFATGISVDRDVADPVLRGNRIARSYPDADGTTPVSAADLRLYADRIPFSIEMAATQGIVADNDIALPRSAVGGIRVRAPGVSVTGNVITVPDTRGGVMPLGILATVGATAGQQGADRCTIEGNQLEGPQLGILVSRCADVAVRANRISSGQELGHVAMYCDATQDARLHGNQCEAMAAGVVLFDAERSTVLDNDFARCLAGMGATEGRDVEFRGNRLHDIGNAGIAIFLTAGSLRLLSNRLSNCAWAETGDGYAIGAWAPMEALYAPLTEAATGAQLTIEGNDIVDTGIATSGTGVLGGAAIGIHAWAPDVIISGNRVGYSRPQALPPAREHRALVIMGPLSLSYALGAGRADYMGGAASLTGNVLHGPGQTHLVEIRTVITQPSPGYSLGWHYERVTFANNQCHHLNTIPSDARVTARLRGGSLAVLGNMVKGPTGLASLHLDNRVRVTVLGNNCTGTYQAVSASARPSPFMNFNY
ncbi:MAG: DUF6519 domain-containing protein [Betaproteobacteria bacterium]